MASDILSILVGEVWRKFGMVAKDSGSAITSGTVNYYLKRLDTNKWWKDSDQSWADEETANVMTHQADGGYTIQLTESPFVDNTIYYEYAKESGDLHVAAEGRLLRGKAIIDEVDLVTTGDAYTLLETISSQVTNLGLGTWKIDVTVTDGVDPLEGARVRFIKGAESYLGITDASGEVSFGLNSGTWTVIVTLPGYLFVPTTLLVEDDDIVTYALAIVSIPASDPDMVSGYLYCYDENFLPQTDAEIQLRFVRIARSGIASDSDTRIATSNVAGLVTFTNLLPGETYQIRRGTSGGWTNFIIPATATDPYTLPSIKGK